MIIEQVEQGCAPLAREEIARRAYQFYEQDGRPKGRELDHWLKAEAELVGARNRANGSASRAPQPANLAGIEQAPQPEQSVMAGLLPIGVKRNAKKSGR